MSHPWLLSFWDTQNPPVTALVTATQTQRETTPATSDVPDLTQAPSTSSAAGLSGRNPSFGPHPHGPSARQLSEGLLGPKPPPPTPVSLRGWSRRPWKGPPGSSGPPRPNTGVPLDPPAPSAPPAPPQAPPQHLSPPRSGPYTCSLPPAHCAHSEHAPLRALSPRTQVPVLRVRVCVTS